MGRLVATYGDEFDRLWANLDGMPSDTLMHTMRRFFETKMDLTKEKVMMLRLLQQGAEVTSGGAGIVYNYSGSGIEGTERTERSFGATRSIGADRDWSQSTTGAYVPWMLPLSDREFYAGYDKRETKMHKDPSKLKEVVKKRMNDALEDARLYLTYKLVQDNATYRTSPETQQDLIGVLTLDRGDTGAVTDLVREPISGSEYATLSMEDTTINRPDGTSMAFWKPSFVHLPSSGNDTLANKPLQLIRRLQQQMSEKTYESKNPDFGLVSTGAYTAIVDAITINGQIPVSNNASGGYISKIGFRKVIDVDGTEITSAMELSTGALGSNNVNANWRMFFAYGDALTLFSWNSALFDVESFYDNRMGGPRWVAHLMAQLLTIPSRVGFGKFYGET